MLQPHKFLKIDLKILRMQKKSAKNIRANYNNCLLSATFSNKFEDLNKKVMSLQSSPLSYIVCMTIAKD